MCGVRPTAGYCVVVSTADLICSLFTACLLWGSAGEGLVSKADVLQSSLGAVPASPAARSSLGAVPASPAARGSADFVFFGEGS